MDLAIGVYKALVEGTLFEVTERVFWKLLLQEDFDEIISGNKIYEAEQELKYIETYISYASFIVAGGINNPELCAWITEAQMDAFCLEDQIDMYRICGSNLDEIISMKRSIGKSSIKGLTERLKNWKKKKPDEVQRFERDPSEFMRKLGEISPFIRYSQVEAAERVFGMDSEIYELIGMDREINELKKLLSESCNHSVVFIIGEKGSGKTTLMKSLYDDKHFKSSFGPCSWVDDTAKITDLAGLLRKVLKGSVEDHDVISELEIMSKIQGTFRGEGKGPYLIVLDDVEDTCALHTLNHVLRGCKGKIICLSTRKNIQEDVEDDMKKDIRTLEVGPLEAHDARKLLMHAAFPGFEVDGEFEAAIEWRAKEKNRDNNDLPAAEKSNTILKQVLGKCKGNPWNIRAVGRLFEANPFKSWEEIQDRIDDGVLIDGNRGVLGKLDPPIELDDPRLSLRIWRSFLYCLAFPKGSEISAQKLARLWMAEGLVEDGPLHSQEHEADSQLQKLIERNLLVEKKKGFDGKLLKCSVNEHIRPLAIDMCKLQKFCRFMPPEPDNNNARSSPSTNSTSRHRVLSVRGDAGVKELLDSVTLGKDIRLRSLLYFGTGKMQREELKVSFKRAQSLPFGRRTYRLLRTLELQGARLGSLPSSIKCLVCLRYLGLRNTQLEDLPESLNMLTKLLCLDIRDTNITSLDDVSTFLEMRHLLLAKSFRGRSSVLIGEGLRSLVHLRTLSGAADGGNLEREISHLGFLRKLSIKVSSESSNKICAAVSNMGFLHSLAITVFYKELAAKQQGKGNNTSTSTTSQGGEEPLDQNKEEEEEEEKTTTPDSRKRRFDIGSLKIGENMRKLKLGGDMGKLSAARISMMRSITHLYLWDSKLDSDDVLRSLQGLQDLLLLSLCNVSTCSVLSCTEGGYRKLKKLSIVYMEKLIDCILGRGAMKNLEELMFATCDKLTTVQGLEHILSLKHVYMSEMDKHLAERVSASATAMGAQPHVVDMHFHKSRRAATERSRIETATEGEGNRIRAVDPVTPPRGAQDKNSGDGTVSAVGSKAASIKLMADAQKSFKHAKPPPSPPFISKTGIEIIPFQEEIEENCDDENGSQTDILVNTKAGAGNGAGITSSMIQMENSKQAKEKLTQEAHEPQLEENDTKDDDIASISAPTYIPETLTNQESPSRSIDEDIQ